MQGEKVVKTNRAIAALSDLKPIAGVNDQPEQPEGKKDHDSLIGKEIRFDYDKGNISILVRFLGNGKLTTKENRGKAEEGSWQLQQNGDVLADVARPPLILKYRFSRDGNNLRLEHQAVNNTTGKIVNTNSATAVLADLKPIAGFNDQPEQPEGKKDHDSIMGKEVLFNYDKDSYQSTTALALRRFHLMEKAILLSVRNTGVIFTMKTDQKSSMTIVLILMNGLIRPVTQSIQS